MILGYPLFRWGVIGGGDSKYVAAVTAFVGFENMAVILYYAVIIGGIYSTVLLVFKGQLVSTMKRIGSFLYALLVPGLSPKLPKKEDSLQVPFGAFLSLAIFWTLWIS